MGKGENICVRMTSRQKHQARKRAKPMSKLWYASKKSHGCVIALRELDESDRKIKEWGEQPTF